MTILEGGAKYGMYPLQRPDGSRPRSALIERATMCPGMPYRPGSAPNAASLTLSLGKLN